MNPPPEFFSGNTSGGGGGTNTPSPRKELQGPRPTALKVNKDSHKIRKPPIVPHPHHTHPPPPHPPADDHRQPVIIYAVSPKVIHTTAGDFMNLVQRLTGNTTAAAGDLSPAARLASIEQTSPKDNREIINSEDNSDFMSDLFEDVEIGGGRFAGILSPAPATLPPISPGFFSPAGDPYMNMFLPSPTTLFSAPLVSPSPSSSASIDLVNLFFDF